jgi:AcrR family transcriptional regulator
MQAFLKEIPMDARSPSPDGARHPHTGGKTRRRGAELEIALLDAAWDELQQVGYAALTMEAIADRAGTSRAVLYRRWPKKPELVIAVVRRHRPLLSGEVPDTGELRGDVLAVLRRMSAGISDIGPETIYGLLGDYLADAELFTRTQGQVLQLGAGVMDTIVQRAVARGEVQGNVGQRVTALPTDLFRHELFLRRTPPTEDAIVQIVDEIFLPLVRGAP